MAKPAPANVGQGQGDLNNSTGANRQHLQFERIGNGEYIWRYKSSNGKQTSWSGETYTSLPNAINGALAGSPLNTLPADWQTSGIGYTYDATLDQLVEIRVSYVDEYEDEHGRRKPKKMPTDPELAEKIISGDDNLNWAYGHGLRRQGWHLITDDGTTYHAKIADADGCMDPNCPMILSTPDPTVT